MDYICDWENTSQSCKRLALSGPLLVSSSLERGGGAQFIVSRGEYTGQHVSVFGGASCRECSGSISPVHPRGQPCPQQRKSLTDRVQRHPPQPSRMLSEVILCCATCHSFGLPLILFTSQAEMTDAIYLLAPSLSQPWGPYSTQ